MKRAFPVLLAVVLLLFALPFAQAEEDAHQTVLVAVDPAAMPEDEEATLWTILSTSPWKASGIKFFICAIRKLKSTPRRVIRFRMNMMSGKKDMNRNSVV